MVFPPTGFTFSATGFAFPATGFGFGGLVSEGVSGSNLNVATNFLNMGPGLLGAGGSMDQGGGGGGFAGGSAAGSGGAMGAAAGAAAGGASGAAGSSPVGGPGSQNTCRKDTPPPPPDQDDALQPAAPSPDSGSSGIGIVDSGTNTVPMTTEQNNSCLGGGITDMVHLLGPESGSGPESGGGPGPELSGCYEDF